MFVRPRCNCPDADNKLDKNLFAKYQSATFDRSWKQRTTESGVQNFNGIRSRGFYCIHELATLITRDEIKDAFPDGVPYEPKIQPLEVFRENDPYDSDYMYVQPIEDTL